MDGFGPAVRRKAVELMDVASRPSRLFFLFRRCASWTVTLLKH